MRRRRERRAAVRARTIRRRRAGALGLLAVLAALTGALAGAGGGGGEPAPAGEPEAAARLSEPLSESELAGQRLIAGWDGVEPPRGLRGLIRRGGVAGVILFAENIPSRGVARRTIASLQRIERPEGLRAPLLVMVDQEGGQVRRLAGPPAGSAAEIGARGESYAREQGRATGASLRRNGFNVDLAPVLDVAEPGGAIGRTGRAFGSEAEGVIAGGLAFAGGLREARVAATAKHFPGIGSIATNTDFAAQTVRDSQSQVRAGERPFEAFIGAGGEMVMSSLASYAAFDDRPAAFSQPIVTGELRERLGFEGVVVTDGLAAAAAQQFGDPARITRAAVRAGNDLLLYSDWRAARGAHALLRDELRSGDLARAPFEGSAARVLALRERLGR